VTLIKRHADLLEQLATGLCEPRALRALLAVEAAGEGLSEGRPIVRIEVHHLWRRVPRQLRAQVDQAFQVRGPRPWEGHHLRRGVGWVPLHQPGASGQRLEHEALTLARGIDEAAAIESTSWGAGQLLGSHWGVLGYTSPAKFAEAQATEAQQVRDFVTFVERVAGLGHSLRTKDWREIARRYNGSGQVEYYAAELAEAYAAA
jgi:hypothetical protein